MAAKRETQEQKLRRIIGEELEGRVGAQVTNSSFVGVQFDAKAVSAIETVATGLVENAKALGELAKTLRASSVDIECMLKIDGIK